MISEIEIPGTSLSLRVLNFKTDLMKQFEDGVKRMERGAKWGGT